ncbi:pentapeptide repeat-containing protein [Desmonostoc muscorum LEGE 12446]|uniref:Pentapeptide repeat-containing protein n=1 Tax=Desmonostoc muscorum LEGE 12446 TaxID=1828758 RepID=A0A8J7D368_DESMC|nr:pentapeptide repeat-containing protein [Desmonostoc muscorum]MCF2151161.1 pentapeptide repeat-containing protein [Desmonostoc muscorum LEGE 12446]
MSDNNTDTLKNWLIILAVIFIIFLVAFILIFLFSDFAFLNPKGLETEQRLDYGAKALTTLGTIFGGFAVLINAFYAAKRWEAMDKTAEAANKSAEAALQNAKAAQDKQITERFAKAIEQLGNEKIETQLGAIYTLERIAKDSKDDHWTIMEVLTAFVRENAGLNKDKEKAENATPQTHIQAALTVIGRRKSQNDPENQRLDFNNIDISRADLAKANLQKADLAQANLQRAILTGTNLQKAILRKTNLQGAHLIEANLQEAVLRAANLQGAYLTQANLQGAYLIEANLQGVYLNKANLQGADLSKANLQGAFLWGAENLEQQQIESAKGDRTTILPENLQPPKHWNVEVSP